MKFGREGSRKGENVCDLASERVSNGWKERGRRFIHVYEGEREGGREEGRREKM